MASKAIEILQNVAMLLIMAARCSTWMECDITSSKCGWLCTLHDRKKPSSENSDSITSSKHRY